MYRWVGVGIVVFALCVVAISSLMSECKVEYTLSTLIFYQAPVGAPITSLSSWVPTSSSSADAVTTMQEVSGIVLVVLAYALLCFLG